jgi:hypothetical protein
MVVVCLKLELGCQQNRANWRTGTKKKATMDMSMNMINAQLGNILLGAWLLLVTWWITKASKEEED